MYCEMVLSQSYKLSPTWVACDLWALDAVSASAVRKEKHNFTRRYLKSLFDRLFGEIALKSWRRSMNIVVLEIQAEYRRRSFSVYLP